MSNTSATELSVRSESIQRLYFLYLADKFNVNRRYQRKLVWSAAEKQRLIDSIIQDLPIPLFLVAEIGVGTDASLEVIDGLQRLNAIFSFLENEIPSLNGEYFDLDALADTKSRKDKGELSQKHPVLSREKSVQFCNYSTAMSVFRALSGASVDEVFRRINSGGRRLSRQELRQAGTVSTLANSVRILSSKVRGDTSPGDIVPLRVMPQLSITNYELEYGVSVDDIFWVRHGILRREDVRVSHDEQVILDILIDCLVEPTPNTGSDIRDEYYNFSQDIDETVEPSQLSVQIDNAIQVYGQDELEGSFLQAYDVLRDILDSHNARFATLIGVKRGGHSPRYFHAVFMAVFELMFKERMRVRDADLIASKLKGITRGALKIPTGSAWTGEAKRASIDAVKGVLRSAFEETSTDLEDFGRYGWASHLETILGNALVEQQLFECKQGMLNLNSESDRRFDSECFDKICRSISAMANMGKSATGYMILGIADTARDANRIEALDNVKASAYRGFHIVGLDREASVLGKSLADYWDMIMRKLRDHPMLDRKLSAQTTANARIVNYGGRSVGVLKISSIDEPVFFGDEMYERSGSETRKLKNPEYSRVYKRFFIGT